MRFFIGVDGGGTKTTAVLCTETGEVLAEQEEFSTNPNDVGVEESVRRLKHVVQGLLESYGMAAHDITSVFCGIAGFMNQKENLCGALREFFPETTLVGFGSDADNILSCGLLNDDGCAVIAGTGSSCFVRIHPDYVRIGGWGYLLDQRGSGFDIGRDCIISALRAFDGRGKKTLLSQMIYERFGAYPQDDLTRIYTLGKPYIASYAPLVFDSAALGDTQANRILEENFAGLGEYIDTAAPYFVGQPFRVILSGGIFNNRETALTLISRCIHCDAILEPLETPVVFGAIIRAQTMAGMNVSDSARQTFMKGKNSVG